MTPTGSLILTLARRGPLSARDLAALGLPRAQLQRLCKRGELVRVERGVYRAADADSTELASVAEVAKRAPGVVMCLLTALQIHGLTTEAPHEVWVMVNNRARSPRITQPRLHVVRASGSAASYGVETRTIEGVDVRITSPAKTVADCFRYRDHVGLDVALAALRDFRRKGRGQPTSIERRARGTGSGFGYGAGTGAGNGDGTGYGDPWFFSIDALVEAARADRVYSVVRPYLEALA
ncbi:MAG: type IV toxin-antitoxin system AbiEi family antitoxin domain-containing protein [Polyangiales bacterium]